MSKWKDISKIDAHIHLTPDDVIEANVFVKPSDNT